MTNLSKCLFAVAFSAPFWPSRPLAEAPPANVIEGIRVVDGQGGVELQVNGSRPPTYTVFKLREPSRLVLDLAGADVSAVKGPLEVRRSGVREVTTAQYNDDKSSVARVIIALEDQARYEVAPRGDAVVVKVTAGEAQKADPAVPAADESAPPPAPATASADDHVLSRHVVEAATDHPATALTSARAQAGGVTLALDGEVTRYEVMELADPPRLVIDLYGVERAPKKAIPLAGAFKQARFGRDEGKVRVVLDARAELPHCEVRPAQGGLLVAEKQVAPARPAVAEAPAAAPAAPARERPLPTKVDPAPAITDLRFSEAKSEARVELTGRANHQILRPDRRTLILKLEHAHLARRLERSLDASAFKGPVATLASYNEPDGGARIVLSLRSEADESLTETESGLTWTISAKGPRAAEASEEPDEAPHTETAEAQAAGFASEAPSYALSGAPQKREYTGRRITLDFHDIDIRNLLRLIADVSKKNIVVADDVTGKVTVSLRNVPWDQALDLILRTKGLDKEEMGNVIRVARVEELTKEQQARMEAAKARVPLLPLKVRLIPVNFARANDLSARVKDVLSERGTVTTDERTNVLIVKDVQDALARAEGLVRNLDTEIPQVRIESRIVEASSNLTKSLGVQWGGNATFSPATGNATGLYFPSIASATGGAGGGPTQGTSGTPNYAVNLPAAIGQGAGGGVGFQFGSAGGAFNLNLVLSALENKGMVKTISAPSVSTIDNKEATIGQGVSIPFSQTSASGVNTLFVEAKLELKVTPHISADGSVLMKIKVTNNSPDPSLTGANGQPSIQKREAETEALVKDGETTVIGGIYTRQTSTNTAQVPFFGNIPILGYFFRNKTDSDQNDELLVFITPRILNRQPAGSSANGG